MLGPFSHGEKGWELSLTLNNQEVRFVVDGRREPDPRLVSKVDSIVTDFAGFSRLIKEFLVMEAQLLPGAAIEIHQLKIEDVCLFWSDKPNEGMIFFKGPSEDRDWHCDYLEGKPSKLVFDT